MSNSHVIEDNGLPTPECGGNTASRRKRKHRISSKSREHRILRHIPRAGEAVQRLCHAVGQSPLKDNKALSRIGAIVVRLQAERHKADYLPPTVGVFSRAEAQELIDLERVALVEIEKLKPNQKDCRMLATCLLFRERNR